MYVMLLLENASVTRQEIRMSIECSGGAIAFRFGSAGLTPGATNMSPLWGLRAFVKRMRQIGFAFRSLLNIEC